MQKLLLCAVLAAASFTVQAKDTAKVPAEQWQVKATYGYVKADGSVVTDLPAMSFTIAVGECKKGITRATKMIHGDVTTTQKACLEKDKNTGHITVTGWLMAPEVVQGAMQINEGRRDMVGLDYGQTLNIVTDGAFVRSSIGDYRVEISRVGVTEKTVKPNHVGAKGSMDGKKIAVGKKVKASKDMAADDNPFAAHLVR